MFDEQARTAALLDAQSRAIELFDEIGDRGLIRAGATETQVSNEIRDLAAETFDVSRFWHKRIVRAGANTLAPYRENPPERTIADDDIVFCDLGPLFADWEADFARTWVLGADPVRHRLRDSLPAVFDAGRDHFLSHPEITGAELYDHVVALANDAGWEFGGSIAGHLIGEFPHEKIAHDEIRSYVAPGSDMRRLDGQGRRCHWILEVHLVDRDRGFGGFYEELLDIGEPVRPV